MCVRVSVCLSVGAMAATKSHNFSTEQRIIAKLSRSSKLTASNFLDGESDPVALGVRPGPQKGGGLSNLSPPRVLK